MPKETNQGGTFVNLREKTEMTATNGHPYLKEGHKFAVHPEQVDKLLRTKWAVKGHVEDGTTVEGAAALNGVEVAAPATADETKTTEKTPKK